MCERNDYHVHTSHGILAPTEPLDDPAWKDRYKIIVNAMIERRDLPMLARLATIGALRYERDAEIERIMRPPPATDMNGSNRPTLVLIEKGDTSEPSPTHPTNEDRQANANASWWRRLTWPPFFSLSRSS